ncbi:antibiotic biosynthesis monooxygenase [Pseudohongiella nitratireducens]|jgi:quinol monooxygenase YgiN|uniref:Antibiotic biosynthesis monooxygenase n=1 Tax=Pseudohongiella nitratireducens TaxID=1768907 RepID=A0A917GXH8_9GAMM|nr:antibiotic biosynthesis monooxygenase [Pseudohongiella nitratireducens]GGG60145.1 antibiotic biosynthesis monooxygenase [Pseudohongiella nitratireducens]
MSRLILKGFILVTESDLMAVKNELNQHIRLTLEEPGCLVFAVNQNADNPLRFDVYEEFIDRASFDAHQQRVKSSHWGKLTNNVERHYEIQEVN